MFTNFVPDRPFLISEKVTQHDSYKFRLFFLHHISLPTHTPHTGQRLNYLYFHIGVCQPTLLVVVVAVRHIDPPIKIALVSDDDVHVAMA